MLKFLFLTRYGSQAASSRQRCYLYLDELERAGINATVSPFLSDRYVAALYAGSRISRLDILRSYFVRLVALFRLRRYDLVWVEKEALPWVPAAVELAFFRAAGARLVLDFDDAIFHRYQQQKNPLIRWLLGSKIDRLMASADLVIVGNPNLGAHAVAAGAGAVIELPTVVDLHHYPMHGAPQQGTGQLFTIGWIGSPLTSPYLEALRPVFAELAKRVPLRLRLIGAGRQALAGLPVEIVSWSGDTEAEALACCDVGVMPLPNGRWERGKCGYKLIQYMASGLPVVASPVGANCSIVIPEETGFLAADEAEWTAALVRLAADPVLRRQMGAAGRLRAEQMYSRQVNTARFIGALHRALFVRATQGKPKDAIGRAGIRARTQTNVALLNHPRLKRFLLGVLGLLPAPAQRFAIGCYRYRLAYLFDFLRWLKKTESYAQWIKQYDTITRADRAVILANIAGLADPPLISVLMPVFNTPQRLLRAALNSVREQLYPHWELCVADDASTAPHVAQVLNEFMARDQRVKLVRCPVNGGISVASNAALSLATGRFVALLDHDDLLPSHALYLVAREIARYPGTDVIYSDEDKLDERGRRIGPYFKSDWNPDLFLGQNMISHFGVYRTSLMREVGGFRSEFDGSQDYDLALRITERSSATRIRHIPHVLYHWRQVRGSAARSPTEKPYAQLAAQRAVADHLRRRCIAAAVDFAPRLPFQQIRHSLVREPRVTIIVPSRDRCDMLSRCVTGVLAGTDYKNFELLVVDNRTSEPASLRYLDKIATEARVRVLRYDRPFNFSLINNWAAAQADGEILLFLNNDTEVIGRDWLQHLVVNALRSEVGAVGAKLLYPNRRVQHGGIILGMGGIAGHFHLRYRDGDPGYFGRAQLQQNLSAVTAACLAMRRQVFDDIGGFDGENLPIAFNDVDLCLRIRERGYLIVWTPLVKLFHNETASRAFDLVGDRREEFARERAYMRSRWGPILDNDPYFNPNLSMDDPAIDLAFPPRQPYPWRCATGVGEDAELRSKIFAISMTEPLAKMCGRASS